MRIKHKIFFNFLVSIVGIIILFSGISYNWVKEELLEQMEENAVQALQEKKNSIENIMQDVENLSRFLVANKRAQDIMKSKPEDFSDDVKKELREMLASLTSRKTYINAIVLLSERGNCFDFRMDFSSSYDYNIIKETAMYQKSLENAGMYEWFVLDESLQAESVKGTIVLARIINDLYTITPNSFVMIQLSSDALVAELNKTKLMDSEAIYILDENNGIVCKSSDLYEEEQIYSLVRQYDGQEQKSGSSPEQLHVTSENISNSGFRLVSVVDIREISATLNYFNLVMKLTIIGTILLGVLLSYIISTYITHPIRILEGNIKREQEQHNLGIKISMEGNDEIANLSRAFENMMEQNNKSILDVYNEKLRRKESEFNLLQAQINPHFLYNTLDTINWLAIANDEEEISRMLLALSKIFRLSLNSGSKYAKVKDEIEHVKSYITIMEQRYPFIVEVQYDIDEQIMDCQTVKTILQPLVENVFAHGFREKMEVGKIFISCKKWGNRILMEVRNNGNRIDLEKIERLLAASGEDSDAERNSFGIYNVHSRIKLKYGADYGLRYSISEAGETVAQIILPYCKEGEKDESTDN